MAVQLESTTYRWLGLSTDTKPTANVKPGSHFFETDTKKTFVYSAAGWTEDIATVDVSDRAARILGKVDLNANTIPDAQAIPMTQASKDIAMRAYENIIDIIGAENIKLLLPMWETSGTEFSDLINPHIKFIAEGVTLNRPGLLHSVPQFDGVNDYIRQKPLTEATAGTSEFAMTASTWKVAQKLTPQSVTGDVKMAGLKMKKVGAPVANVVLKLVEDNAGGPTGATVATFEALSAAGLFTTAAMWFAYLTTGYNAERNKTYWITAEYANVTTIDVSNHVVFVYDNAGAYGQAKATFDGTTWTVAPTESFVVEVYSDNLTLSNDFTIIAAAAINGTQKTIYQPAIGSFIINGGSLILGTMVNISDVQVYACGGGTTLLSKNIVPTISSSIFDVFASSFSFADSADKYKLYRNAALQAKGNGTASTGANPPQQPFVIGAARNPSSYVYYAFMNGRVGPVIVASSVVTQANLAKINNQLLALRRRN